MVFCLNNGLIFIEKYEKKSIWLGVVLQRNGGWASVGCRRGAGSNGWGKKGRLIEQTGWFVTPAVTSSTIDVIYLCVAGNITATCVRLLIVSAVQFCV